jgi:hypothetical protein
MSNYSTSTVPEWAQTTRPQTRQIEPSLAPQHNDYIAQYMARVREIYPSHQGRPELAPTEPFAFARSI